jgi:type VI secretion system protein ImpH
METIENIHNYSFHQVMRILEQKNLLSKTHLNSSESLSFPASDIQSIKTDAKGNILLLVNFMGLIGVDSPLPHYFIELANQDNEAGQRLRSLLNLFSESILFLLYKAWRQYHPFVQLEQASSTYLMQLRSLSGNKLKEQDRQEYALAGLLGTKFRGTVGLCSSLKLLLGTDDVSIKAFQPHWVHAPALLLNRDNIILSDNSFLGENILDLQRRIEIIVSGVSFESLENKKIQNFIKRYLKPTQFYSLRLNMFIPTNRRTILGHDKRCYLGFSTCLGRPLSTQYELTLANKEQ